MGSHLKLKWHPMGTHEPPGLLWGGFGSKPSGATAAFLAGAFWFHPANILLGWIWLQALQGNCGVPCRGIAFTQKTIFLVCWSKEPSRATVAFLAGVAGPGGWAGQPRVPRGPRVPRVSKVPGVPR